MKGLFFAVAVFLGVSIATAGAVAETADNRASLKQEISEEFVTELGSVVVSSLKEMGIAEIDAKRILATLAGETTECFMQAVESAIRNRGLDPKSIIADAAVEDLGGYFESRAEADQLLDSCLFVALSNAGIEAE